MKPEVQRTDYEPDEAALLELLRAGDDTAFETVVRQNTGRLLAVTRRFLGNEEDARDALQEAFLSAFRKIDQFKGDSRLSTWLHRIAVNAALMKLRSRKRRPEESIEELLPRFQEDGHQVDPAVRWSDQELSRQESRRLVRGFIDRLSETYRSVILLRDIEGYDTAETARLLQTTEGNVKVRLHRARQALRSLLDGQIRRRLA